MTSHPDMSHNLPFDADGVAPAPMTDTRPLYWSVRRELWENRSIYLAPLIVSAVVLFGTLMSTMVKLPRTMRAPSTLDPANRFASVIEPFSTSPAPIVLATFIVAFFYCLDALYGERRDRSILFWKSLPVSDRVAVLSKASIPLAVLPAIAFVLGAAVQIVLLSVSSATLLVNGLSPVPLWGELRLFSGLVTLFYGATAHALWFAPIYGWLLLISAWAKRSPFLWAVLPPLAIAAVEMTLGTTGFRSMLRYRIGGAMAEAFAFEAKRRGGDVNHFSQLTPMNFLATPGLWIGLIFAAAFLAVAARLRRNREPI